MHIRSLDSCYSKMLPLSLVLAASTLYCLLWKLRFSLLLRAATTDATADAAARVVLPLLFFLMYASVAEAPFAPFSCLPRISTS